MNSLVASLDHLTLEPRTPFETQLLPPLIEASPTFERSVRFGREVQSFDGLALLASSVQKLEI